MSCNQIIISINSQITFLCKNDLGNFTYKVKMNKIRNILFASVTSDYLLVSFFIGHS